MVPLAGHKTSVSLHAPFGILKCLTFANLMGMKSHLITILACVYLIIHGFEYLFIYLLAIWISSSTIAFLHLGPFFYLFSYFQISGRNSLHKNILDVFSCLFLNSYLFPSSE